MIKKQSNRKIIAFCLMIVFLLSSLVALSFAWFTDKKEADITITAGKISGTVASSDAISSSDLIANNNFTKSLSISINSEFSVYFRVYATITTQTNSGDRTDIVSLTGVSKTIKGLDNKFYYCGTGANATTISGNNSYTLTCTFHVSESYSEDYYVSGGKTTISYFVEYCQEAAFQTWKQL